MIKTAFAATLAVLFTFCAPANAQFTYTPESSDEVGLYLGTQIWHSEASGSLGEENMLIDFNKYGIEELSDSEKKKVDPNDIEVINFLKDSLGSMDE